MMLIYGVITDNYLRKYNVTVKLLNKVYNMHVLVQQRQTVE